MSKARCIAIVGSLYALMRQMLGLNVATTLGPQELSCTVAPARRLVVLGTTPIAGFAVDHGTVADEAAMLALHTLDSATLRTEPTFVAPGDSCLRADDPGWRWHCISGHGTTLADWERRPLAGALADVASGIAGAQPLDADLTAIAAQGVSAWGLARMADSGATAAKNALSIVRSDIGDASTAGRNLLGVAAPSGPKLVQVNADGSVSLVDASSGGGSALPVARLTRSTQWDFSSMAGIPWEACTTYVGSGLWSSANPSRLYATEAGLWRASVWMRTSGVTAVLFHRNGVDQSIGWREVWNGAQTDLWSCDADMAAGDFLEVFCYNSGSVLYNAGNSPLCTWQRIG